MDNKNNKNWWDKHTMSYADWDLDENIRLEDSSETINKLNQRYISGNPFLKDFFIDLKSKKNNNAIIFDKVLDIGCGWGSSSILLSNLFNNVHAIDISSTSVLKAKKNIDLSQKKNIELEEFDAENLDVKNTYDFIYSWGVIHHSVNPSKIYKNMFNSLKVNGTFMIMVYNKGLRYWLRGLYDLFVKLKILKGYNFDTVQKFSSDGYYHKHYTPKKLINELKLIGFKNLEYELSHVENISLTFVKRRTNLDNFLKKNFGDFLIVYGKK
jgi:2-polyprenyl-3-methyl-5-hydroxy-6-metoxy-1,4-benzoquinol methylase